MTGSEMDGAKHWAWLVGTTLRVTFESPIRNQVETRRPQADALAVPKFPETIFGICSRSFYRRTMTYKQVNAAKIRRFFFFFILLLLSLSKWFLFRYLYLLITYANRFRKLPASPS